jgi:ubiquinone/menaquinone biosynthesis C-methylase UbiE
MADESSGNIARVREQFSRQADAYSQMDVVRSDKLLNAIADATGVRPEHRVLDLASGPGYLTMVLATRAREAIGVDATERFVAQATAEAARRGIANVSFRAGDVERLDLPDASFDVVTCKFAFHHFPRPARVLAEMARVAKPGATLLIADMVASEDADERDYQDRIERLCDPSHASAIMGSEFDRMFLEQGLEVVGTHRRETSYTVRDWMAHGGPSEEAAREIATLFEASLDVDRSGLRVRRENGELCFSHQGATFVLRKP